MYASGEIVTQKITTAEAICIIEYLTDLVEEVNQQDNAVAEVKNILNKTL